MEEKNTRSPAEVTLFGPWIVVAVKRPLDVCMSVVHAGAKGLVNACVQ